MPLPDPYPAIYRRLLTRVDPEEAHVAALRAIAAAGRVEPVRRLLKATVGRAPAVPLAPAPHGPFARQVPSVVGLAAGMDKDGRAILGLDALGFGFVEVGTVTAHPQPGNPRPRMWRHPELHGLRNAMGFNNAGADVLAQRLREMRSTRQGRGVVVGVNIGKSRVTPVEDSVADHEHSARVLARWADYLVVNVSSPNTPGLRELQHVDALRPILTAVQRAADDAADRRVPLLVKIAPDLAPADVDAVADLALDLDLAGVSATNTTIDHDLGAGGLSGSPLTLRSREIVARLRGRLGPDRVIIGVGGIGSVDDARAMLGAGADLVQIYSSFVEQGPFLPGRLARQA
ncbi:quinone-dependent dihydroorotate dehydrogenase [Georgenia sp. Z1344]|uniref:quinone-dependent dihydroorotate dehydrogenase n=1 Tax=Georgenia sp. Z1344 TaxID=3416706 RepID=UPI003CF9F8A3